MTTFGFVHGAGGSGWEWHLVEEELRALGHRTIAPDLTADDDSATLSDYADVLLSALGDAGDDVVVVGHSFGAFTAPLVAARRPVSGLVLVSGMVSRPGEPPDDWWSATGYAETAEDDPLVCYYHDVPERLAAEALARERNHPSPAAGAQPWPLEHWPDVPTRFILCTEDRLFPAEFMARVVRERLGVVPEEISTGHCPGLARPRELAALLGSGRPWTAHGLRPPRPPVT